VQFLKPDSWSGTHLFGSFFLCKCLIFLGLGVYQASLTALSLGIIWECLDEMFGKGCGVVWFDSRGYDSSDVLCDAIGCGLALCF